VGEVKSRVRDSLGSSGQNQVEGSGRGVLVWMEIQLDSRVWLI